MAERFRKIRLLGKGGFGTVFEAIDLKTGETVALKEMFGTYENWDACCNLTEVRALQVLSHPHIVSLKEVFLSESKLYLAYELLDRDLFQMIDEHRAKHSYLDEEHVKVLLF